MMELLQKVEKEYEKVIVGQKSLLQRVFIALLCEGHILVEGVPGLAKTEAVKTIAKILNLSFSRIQFTPDLLPADITGTLILNPKNQRFETHKGPIFANVILADEINRAPSKVQSALLEAMQEGQVTIIDTTFVLEKPYIVLATQNPLDHEGTYALPEAQIDRFLFRVKMQYPQQEEEINIIQKHMNDEKLSSPQTILDAKEIASLQKKVKKVYMDEKIIRFIARVVEATRNPSKVGLLDELVFRGASPRAAVWLAKAARAHAFVMGMDFVRPEDVVDVALDVLSHRVVPSYEAETQSLSSEQILQEILLKVDLP